MKLDLLHRHAAELGVSVEWGTLAPFRHGEYRHHLQLITLNGTLTRAQATAALAHEIAHAIHADKYSSPAIELRADRTGAALVITLDEYRVAEALVGPHPGALAREMGVTARLVLAWREWARTSGLPTQALA